jgi:hypothetical protein
MAERPKLFGDGVPKHVDTFSRAQHAGPRPWMTVGVDVHFHKSRVGGVARKRRRALASEFTQPPPG